MTGSPTQGAYGSPPADPNDPEGGEEEPGPGDTSGPFGNGTANPTPPEPDDNEDPEEDQESEAQGEGQGGDGGNNQAQGQQQVPPGGYESPFLAGVGGFIYGFGQGFVNIGKGVAKTAYQTTLMAADTVGVAADALGTTVGLPLNYEVMSDTGQAVESGDLTLTQFYGEAAANTATFGVYGEVQLTRQWLAGEISDDEYSEGMGAAGVLQLAGARSLKNTKLGNTPVQEIPATLVRQTKQAFKQGVKTAKEFLADERGSISLDGKPLPTQAELTQSQQYAGRSAAFRQAKRDAGIIVSQQPARMQRVPMTRYGRVVTGQDGKPIMTREYIFQRRDGTEIVIQDHSAGHSFGGTGDVLPHFNVRPIYDLRHGVVPGTRPHYSF